MARIFALAVALSSVICNLTAQNVITTFAGGPKIFTGGPATSISVSPSRIAVGPKGEVYFGDREANVVLRLNADGTLSVIAGNGAAGYSGDGGPATQASLNQPAGFAVDAQGNLYIGDARNFRVRKVDTNGIITTVAGNGQQGFSGDGGPATAAQIAFTGPFTTTSNGHTPVEFGGNIAVDAGGNLYIADTLNNRVRRVSGGVITTVAGNGATQGFGPLGDGGPATAAIVLVTAVAVDSSGNLYIAGGAGIRKVTPAGIIGTFNLMTGALSLATDSTGNLYASNGQVISRVTDSQTFTVFSNLQSGGVNNAAGLYGIAVDSKGTVYAAADLGEYIIKIPANAPSTNIAGTGSPAYSGDGGPASSAGLSAPNSMAIDTAGTIYIADTNDRRVRAVDTSGVITTFADLSKNAFPAFGLYNIAVAADGGILIDDRNSIQEAHKDGSLTEIAVSGANPTGDGRLGANIPLQTLDIASDTFGNIYIINSDFTVGKIDKSGVFSIPGGGVKVSCAIFLHQCITTDRGGNVYVPAGAPLVSPTTIAKITPTGTVTMIPVTGASAIAGIAVDSLGNIYVSDTGNHNQVLKILPDGTTAPFAGNGQYGFSGDGGPALQATLFGPVGLLVDYFDNVYIADNLNNRVRKVATGTISYFAAPTTLSFQATAGGPAPPPQTITLTAATSGLAFTASSDSPWLTITPSSGAMPATLQAGVNPASLAAGTYKGTITISAPGVANPTTLIAVNLTVTAGQPGNITTGSSSISFSVTQGSASTSSTLSLINSGGAPVNYTASIDFQGAPNFVSVSPTTGTVTSAQAATLTLTVNPQNLAIGSYSATLRIVGENGQMLSVPVTLSIAAPMQRLVVSQAALSFIAIQGAAPAAQTLGLVNTGNGVLSWMVTASPLSGSTTWLSVDKSAGNIANPFKDVALVSVMVNPAGLSAGDYFGQIVVTSTGTTGSPQVIPVTLSVVTADPGLDVSPTGLIFNGAASTQDVVITNRTGKPINFTTAQSGVGFTYTPSNGIADPSNPTAIHISSDFSKVPPGDSRRGTITISFADGSTRTISVLSIVGPLTSK
jgi:sugar lactone lactonase YvrE